MHHRKFTIKWIKKHQITRQTDAAVSFARSNGDEYTAPNRTPCDLRNTASALAWRFPFPVSAAAGHRPPTRSGRSPTSHSPWQIKNTSTVQSSSNPSNGGICLGERRLYGSHTLIDGPNRGVPSDDSCGESGDADAWQGRISGACCRSFLDDDEFESLLRGSSSSSSSSSSSPSSISWEDWAEPIFGVKLRKRTGRLGELPAELMRMEGDWGRPAWMGFENASGFFFRPSRVFEMKWNEMRRDLGFWTRRRICSRSFEVRLCVKRVQWIDQRLRRELRQLSFWLVCVWHRLLVFQTFGSRLQIEWSSLK